MHVSSVADIGYTVRESALSRKHGAYESRLLGLMREGNKALQRNHAKIAYVDSCGCVSAPLHEEWAGSAIRAAGLLLL